MQNFLVAERQNFFGGVNFDGGVLDQRIEQIGRHALIDVPITGEILQAGKKEIGATPLQSRRAQRSPRPEHGTSKRFNKVGASHYNLQRKGNRNEKNSVRGLITCNEKRTATKKTRCEDL